MTAWHRQRFRTRPINDAIRAEVELEFATVVGGNDIAMRAQIPVLPDRTLVPVDQFIETRDVFLRCDTPDARRRRCGREFDTIRQRTKQQFVIDEVALVGIQMGTEPALVFA